MCWMKTDSDMAYKVQTGATIDGYTVIEDGLKEGDKVVIAK